MFQLIVAVSSIAIVASLALASIFYGGEAYTAAQARAAAKGKPAIEKKYEEPTSSYLPRVWSTDETF